MGYQFLVKLVGVGWLSLFTSKPRNWFSSCSVSFSLFEEVLLELLDAVWTSTTWSLLDEVVSGEGVSGSFFTSSSSFCAIISKAILSLDLRLACLVVGSLTKGFSMIWTGLLEFPG